MTCNASDIRKVAVIGAGVMGAGIAAHCANAGLDVLLLDIVPQDAKDRNAVAKGALQKLLKADPAPFMSKRFAKRVTPGNIDDDLGQLADCDWIVEAVIERQDVKQGLYEKIEAHRKPGSLVSSNTSTLPLARLTDGMPESFKADFMITHFFNPPRYMRLLEIVSGPETRPEAVERMAEIADRCLGKGVIYCNDTPGFVANRIGTFWIQAALVDALDLGLPIEEADAVMSRPVGIPKTGVFGLMDLVGIDLMPHVDEGLADNLAEGDRYHAIRRNLPLIQRMIEEGYTGRKGKGGFYRINREGGGKVKEAINLEDGSYAPARKVALESLEAAKALKGPKGLQALVAHPDRGGRYAWAVLSKVLGYAASLVPEIAGDIASVDRAMQLGYAWKYGPFELIDRLGAKAFAERLAAEGGEVPGLLAKAAESGGFYRVHEGRREQLMPEGSYQPLERAEGVELLEDIKLTREPLARNGSASLWDVGGGVACFEIHTKLNTIDADVMAILGKALEIVPRQGFKALVIYNEGSHFSAGANLGLALFAANAALWPMVEDMVGQGQKLYRKLRQAPFPVVAAPTGLALGGGCEICLSADAIQAHAETYMGLVEVGVGVIPGWGGCTELLARLAADPRRPKGPMPPVVEAFETIGMAKVAKSAFEAKEFGFLRAGDGITFNRDRLLADAKAKALELAEGYEAPAPLELTLPGPTGKTTLDFALRDLAAKGVATPYDKVVAGELSGVLTGGPGADHTEPTGEATVLKLEREAFMRLVRNEATLARMETMLTTGKPLRN